MPYCRKKLKARKCYSCRRRFVSINPLKFCHKCRNLSVRERHNKLINSMDRKLKKMGINP